MIKQKTVPTQFTLFFFCGFNWNRTSIFPDEHLPARLFFGTPFKNLPIVNIKTTPNNTIINVTDGKGLCKFLHSCGVEGFKNTRKGTNIAAQATATTIAAVCDLILCHRNVPFLIYLFIIQRALERGIKHVRVTVQGLGPGRMVNFWNTIMSYQIVMVALNVQIFMQII